MEKLQEMGLKLFLLVFKKLYNFTEFGEPVEVQTEQERAESGLLMRQYGAQIDALIKLNMKNFSESSAKCILHAFKLFQKFCKLMVWADADMVRKLFFIVSQGVIQPLKRTALINSELIYNTQSHKARTIVRKSSHRSTC